MRIIKPALLLAAAAALLSAADAPKTFSPEFAKAGLKAVITVDRIAVEGRDGEIADSAMTDADVAVSSNADRRAYERISMHKMVLRVTGLRMRSEANSGTFTESDKAELAAIHTLMNLNLECGSQLEGMLHGRVLIDTPACSQAQTQAVAKKP
jgi:hypothetical protein